MTLSGAAALVVGAGALGSPVATYLTAAGIGTIGIVDEVAGAAAAAQLGTLNPEVLVEPYPARVEAANAEALVAGQDVVVDCSNSDDTHQLLTIACRGQGIPLVVAGGAELSGFLTSACFRCAGAMPAGEMVGAVAGILGSAQALETIKLLSGSGRPLLERVVRLDGAAFEWTDEPVSRDPGCPLCGTAPQSS